MAKRRVATDRAWATRDVSPEDLPDLLTAPPRASLAWVDDDSAIQLAPVAARFDGSTWQVGRARGRGRPRPRRSRGRSRGRRRPRLVRAAIGHRTRNGLRAAAARPAAVVDPARPHRRVGLRQPAPHRGPRHSDASPTRTPAAVVPPSRRSHVPTPVQLPPEAARVIRRARVLLLATASARSRPFCVPEWFLHHRGTFVTCRPAPARGRPATRPPTRRSSS